VKPQTLHSHLLLLFQVRGLLPRSLQQVFCAVQLVHKPLCRIVALERGQVVAVARLVGRGGLRRLLRLIDPQIQFGQSGLRINHRLQRIQGAGNPRDQVEQKGGLVIVGVQGDGGVLRATLPHLQLGRRVRGHRQPEAIEVRRGLGGLQALVKRPSAIAARVLQQNRAIDVRGVGSRVSH
jgi:hypothetical protein